MTDYSEISVAGYLACQLSLQSTQAEATYLSHFMHQTLSDKLAGQ